MKTCALGRVGRGRVGGEEGPGLLTWPFGNGSVSRSLPSLDSAIAATDFRARLVMDFFGIAANDSRACLATDLFPAPVCLDSWATRGTKAYFLDLPNSGLTEIGGKVAGSRGVAEIPCPQEGKVLPKAGLEMPPRDFFSWTPFLLGVDHGRLTVEEAAGADATATPW